MMSEAIRSSRVVVIDDVASNLRLLESSLRTFGLEHIKTFSDSAAGLAWLLKNPWDLLLLDLDMPTPSGFDILQKLAQRDHSRSPVIIISALSRAEDRRKGLEMGAQDYICKPVDMFDLILRVRNNLQLSLASQSLHQERDQLEEQVQERTAQLNCSFQALIRSLSRAAAYKDNETGNHVLRIGESAALLATALGHAPQWVEQLRLAAPMHDVGKIGIADAILGKPGILTAAERVIMNEHARIGYEILCDEQASPLTELAAEIALYHHEKWDGSGYPYGLKGEAIPLAARIVAICDVYDALRSHRPYKQAWTQERAQSYMCEQSGRHFDPELVEVFKALFDEVDDLQQHLGDESASIRSPF